ncbi:CocE/NonD family hydrolase [Streptacidiphilus sp. BW17]|uniref:CocE/NonD family hydrolase n=1 Tax=Streptacidiphilus sp. BW17 TaxID=3156274 RepID=UPI003511864B
MSETPDLSGPYRIDVNDGMTIEWDVPIQIDDGSVLRADVFRPTGPGTYPTLLASGPYGKGRPFQDSWPAQWHKLVADHPDVLDGSSGRYQVFELVDPEKWVPDGYVCVRVDSRGAGRSPGVLDPFSERETRDLYECIEWAARQPWSNGRVGLSGISYFAMNQWRIAAAPPPHLSAICAWEGAADWYRDITYHGGILSTFIDFWYGALISGSQYGLGEKGGRNPHTGQLVCGDETFTDAQLAERRVDLRRVVRLHPLLDDHHRSRSADLSKVTVPLLSAGNWGGLGLHLRGNTRGFELAASRDKWLTMHNEHHLPLFYAQYGRDLQKRFFGHFLKGEETGWTRQPRVHLLTRHPDGTTSERTGKDWPLPETAWTPLHLDANDHSLRPTPAPDAGATNYTGQEGRLSFTYRCPHDIEIAGPVTAKLYIESTTTDADLFLVLRAFRPDGTEIVFEGANDNHVPITQGWMRASHRSLDTAQSRPHLPVHRHDHAEPLIPGTVYELDVEIWPTSLHLTAGHILTLDIQAHDYVHPGAVAEVRPDLQIPFTGSGPFLHNDPDDRPDDIHQGTLTLHTGGPHASRLLLPVVSVQPGTDAGFR